MLLDVIHGMDLGALWVIAGDFNLPVALVRDHVEGTGAVVVDPGEATCLPTVGEPSVLDYFVVSPAAACLLG